MTSLYVQNRTGKLEIGHVFDMLADALRQVGLVWNAGNTQKKLTTQRQHPAELVSPGGIVLDFGTRVCTQVVGLYDTRPHGWQPRT